MQGAKPLPLHQRVITVVVLLVLLGLIAVCCSPVMGSAGGIS